MSERVSSRTANLRLSGWPTPHPPRTTHQFNSSSFYLLRALPSITTALHRNKQAGGEAFSNPLDPAHTSQLVGSRRPWAGYGPACRHHDTPRRGRGSRRHPLRQDGRWPGVGRRKEREEGGNSHLPAAVPAVWAEAGGRRTWSLSAVSGLLSVIFSPGSTVVWLGNPGCSWTLRWPLELWGKERVGEQTRRPAHLVPPLWPASSPCFL